MNEPRIVHIEARVHGRLLIREALASPAPLLVCFHGYGQSGEDFLDQVCTVPGTSDWHVAAIQALHPFYGRRTGAVGAGWMTSQDRDLAISDNIAYVTRAIDEIGSHLKQKGPTVFVGFSQGTAMAYRAAFLSECRCDGLIALAGDAPSEIEAESVRTVPRILIGRGEDDTWYDETKLEVDVAMLSRMDCEIETCAFAGGHEWTDAFRTSAAAFLNLFHRQDDDGSVVTVI